MIRKLLLALALAAILPSTSYAQWREAPRSMQAAPQRYTDCRAVDGDTLAAARGVCGCAGWIRRSVARAVIAPRNKSYGVGRPAVP